VLTQCEDAREDDEVETEAEKSSRVSHGTHFVRRKEQRFRNKTKTGTR